MVCFVKCLRWLRRAFYFWEKIMYFTAKEVMKKILITAIIAFVFSVGFFTLTNPDSVPVGALMVPILLAFGVVSIVFYLLFHLFGAFGKTERKQKSVAVLCGVVAASCLVFQSTGGIVMSDVILLVLIFVVSILYIVKY
jgi:hypothetical protein